MARYQAVILCLVLFCAVALAGRDKCYYTYNAVAR